MASPMEALNASQTSFPGAIHATISSSETGLLGKMYESTSLFGAFLTLFAVAVVYDQSKH